MPNSASDRSQFVIDALERYECLLTRYARRLLGGDLDGARDAVQHTLLKLCEQNPDRVRHKLAPWLYTVCRNRCLDEKRGRQTREQLDVERITRPQQNGRTPLAVVEERDFLNRLQQMIDRLPNSEREAIELWSQGFSNAEMAEIAGKSSGAIRLCLHRGIKRLRSFDDVRQHIEESNVDQQRDVSPLSDRSCVKPPVVVDRRHEH